VSEIKAAAHTLRLRLLTRNVSTASDIDLAFASLVKEQAGALLVGAGAFSMKRSLQIAAALDTQSARSNHFTRPHAARFQRYMDFVNSLRTAAWSATAMAFLRFQRYMHMSKQQFVGRRKSE
jgi:hypothetical protein